MGGPAFPGRLRAPRSPPPDHTSERRSYSVFEIDSSSSSNSSSGFEEAGTDWRGDEDALSSDLSPPSRRSFLMHLIRLKALWMRWIDDFLSSVCRVSRSLHAVSSKRYPRHLRGVPLKMGGAAFLLVLLAARLWRLRGTYRKSSGVALGAGGGSASGPSKATREHGGVGSSLGRALFFWRSFGWKTPAAAAAEPFSRVLELVGGNAVKEVHFGPGPRLLLELKDRRRVVSSLVPGAETAFFHAVSTRVPRFKAVQGGWLPAAISFAAPLLLMGVWFRLLRGLLLQLQPQTRDTGTEREAAGAPPQTRFHDIVFRQKEELQEIVWLLNGQQDLYSEMGARLPRGVLLVGPAGTGKTLLARAVAGETRAAFLSAAASEFTDVFVGQGARRVRELFREARQRAPCVVFIDELDALGSRSGSPSLPEGAQAANQEYVQTINQLLAEIDGVMGAAAGVVVIAATNRLEAIDPALLRSGRFDRLIHLRLPDEGERLEILQLHAGLKKIRLSSAAQGHLKNLAAAADGLSGADLENLLNESVFKAVRKGKTHVDEDALNEALLTLLQRTHPPRPPTERLVLNSIFSPSF
ncbi:Similarity to FtsH, related [Eimeria mitis]|uniref:Similarity to FtsH, related n=1 Tax=Eimeria mitis TaxID=44415 RepID=U6KDQ7_9EIME|nr:Similarity to FtsH, related [Eimeria mitis]CDJ36170.1 Similarity to FtsH, related [Eimeria mitis]